MGIYPSSKNIKTCKRMINAKLILYCLTKLVSGDLSIYYFLYFLRFEIFISLKKQNQNTGMRFHESTVASHLLRLSSHGSSELMEFYGYGEVTCIENDVNLSVDFLRHIRIPSWSFFQVWAYCVYRGSFYSTVPLNVQILLLWYIQVFLRKLPFKSMEVARSLQIQVTDYLTKSDFSSNSFLLTKAQRLAITMLL